MFIAKNKVLSSLSKWNRWCSLALSLYLTSFEACILSLVGLCTEKPSFRTLQNRVAQTKSPSFSNSWTQEYFCWDRRAFLVVEPQEHATVFTFLCFTNSSSHFESIRKSVMTVICDTFDVCMYYVPCNCFKTTCDNS